MQTTIALVESQELVHLHTFTPEEHVEEVLSGADLLAKRAPQIVFLSSELNHDFAQSFRQHFGHAFPIVPDDGPQMTQEDLQELNYESAHQLEKKTLPGWLLLNNLHFIEQLVPLCQFMRTQWEQDPKLFFPELWSFLHANLGPTHMDILFHDLATGEGEDNKENLVLAKIGGASMAQFLSPSLGDQALMEELKSEFEQTCSVIEWEKEQGKLALAANIDKSPILILADIADLNRVQLNLIRGLFIGMQKN